MGAHSDDFDRIIRGIAGITQNLEPELKVMGEQVAESIVQTTLAGIGENDAPFASYSPTYQQTLAAVGGKSRNVVDLRGVFYHDGQKRTKFRSEARRQAARAGRRAYVGVAFASLKSGIRSFQGRTPETRPAVGLTDKNSEMSLDLIQVEATNSGVKILYEERDNPYMAMHQNGTARGGKVRKWFTARKTAVKAAAMDALKRALAARVQRFNDKRGGS